MNSKEKKIEEKQREEKKICDEFTAVYKINFMKRTLQTVVIQFMKILLTQNKKIAQLQQDIDNLRDRIDGLESNERYRQQEDFEY